MHALSFSLLISLSIESLDKLFAFACVVWFVQVLDSHSLFVSLVFGEKEG